MLCITICSRQDSIAQTFWLASTNILQDKFLLIIQQDLSQNVTPEGDRYIARGEFADLWVGKLIDKKVKSGKLPIMKTLLTIESRLQ
jgi:hypothetical protein